MPRLFTGLEIPPDISQSLSMLRGGLPGGRWIDPENYHVTLRFIGDIDDYVAREIATTLERVDRQPFDVGIIRYGLEYPVDHTLFDPAVIAPLRRLIGTEPIFRQVAPATTRSRQPQQGIEKTPTIAARAALAFASAGHKLPKPFPLIVP